MSSVMFVSWWGGGNMTPVLALGAEMRARGHAVTVVGPARFADRLAVDGVAHAPSASWSPTVEEVEAAVARERPDLLVVDFMMAEVVAAAPALVAGGGRPRSAALVHTLWQPVADRVWNNVGAFTSLDTINGVRARHELAEVEHPVELLRSVDHIVIAEPEAIDRPAASRWPSAHYLGPLLEPVGPDAGWEPPFASGDDRPLLVVSLGTTPMEEEAVLGRVLDAVAGLDVRVFATVGEHLDHAAFARGADAPNIVVGPYTRHATVLPHASLVITHAGLGTVIAAAAHAVPVVCIPLGRDQPGNARRVEELGIGRALEATASIDEIRAAVTAVLDSNEVRSTVEALRDEIARRHPSPYDEFERLLYARP